MTILKAGEGAIATSRRQGENRAGVSGISELPHLLSNFEIQKCYQNKPEFNGVDSRNNLPK